MLEGIPVRPPSPVFGAGRHLPALSVVEGSRLFGSPCGLCLLPVRLSPPSSRPEPSSQSIAKCVLCIPDALAGRRDLGCTYASPPPMTYGFRLHDRPFSWDRLQPVRFALRCCSGELRARSLLLSSRAKRPTCFHCSQRERRSQSRGTLARLMPISPPMGYTPHLNGRPPLWAAPVLVAQAGCPMRRSCAWGF